MPPLQCMPLKAVLLYLYRHVYVAMFLLSIYRHIYYLGPLTPFFHIQTYLYFRLPLVLYIDINIFPLSFCLYRIKIDNVAVLLSIYVDMSIQQPSSCLYVDLSIQSSSSCLYVDMSIQSPSSLPFHRTRPRVNSLRITALNVRKCAQYWRPGSPLRIQMTKKIWDNFINKCGFTALQRAQLGNATCFLAVIQLGNNFRCKGRLAAHQASQRQRI